jgi:acyl-[acyl-carrier-protein]-phospholipid O-acyltransferase/long-chain-fatty-acid--[acyl-carrier-protein] ligase
MLKPPKWLPLFSTQFLGVFNDNFLKNLIIFISIFWLAEQQQGLVIPVASALLVIPFVLLSPLAGRLAQVYSKQRIFEYAKLAEIPIMVIAIIGFYSESITIVMTALLLMGIQSALYSPSKFGLIRDVGGSEGLSYGVGTMEFLTFLGVLIGQIAAGFVSDLSSGIDPMLSSILMVFAIGGYISSRRIKVHEEKPMEKSKDSVEPFSFLYKTAKWAKKVKGLNTTILGLGCFWLVAAMIQMNIYEHAPKVFSLSNTETSFVMALIAIGIGLGCFLSGKLSKNRVELGMVPLGGLGLSIITTIFATIELEITPFIICLFFAALSAGFYKVPLSAWIQERVEGRKLGLALAYNQLIAFLFILIAAGLFGYVVNTFNTYAVFAVIALVSWIMTLATIMNIPAMMIRFIAYIMAHSYFKFDIEGSHHIPKKSGALLVANHLSLLDAFFVVATTSRMLRFVMAKDLYEFWLWHWLMKRLNMIPISANQGKEKLEEFNEICRREVSQGHVVCIFPEGQISRIGHLLEFKKGIEHIAKGIAEPIIPIQMGGITGVPMSFEIGSSKPIMRLLSSFRKRISIEVGEPLPSNSSSHFLRQKVQLLNAITFEKRLRKYHSLQYFMGKSAKKFKQRSFQYGADEQSFESFFINAQMMAGFWNKISSQYVGIDMGNHPQLGMIHASLLFGGKIPVFLHPDMETAYKDFILKKYRIECVVSPEKSSDQNVTPDDIISTRNKQNSNAEISDIAGIFYEKGNDNQWTVLPMRHANILASVKGFMQLFQNQEARVYSDFPSYTTYGNILKIWVPYFFGTSVYVPGKGTDLTTDWSVNRIDALFATSDTIHRLENVLNDSDWHHVKYVITGTESITDKLKQKLESFGIFVSSSLGTPKSGIAIAVNTPDYELNDLGGNKMMQNGSQTGSKGRPLPGIGIKILDEQGIELPPGEIGHLSLFGAGICDEYKDQDGWVETDVQAHYDEEGFLYHLAQKSI